MAKSAMIRARIEPELKNEADEILKHLGLSTTQAITLFYRQLVLQRRLPLELAVPNDATLQVFKKTDSGEDLVRCADADDMFDKLGV